MYLVVPAAERGRVVVLLSVAGWLPQEDLEAAASCCSTRYSGSEAAIRTEICSGRAAPTFLLLFFVG